MTHRVIFVRLRRWRAPYQQLVDEDKVLLNGEMVIAYDVPDMPCDMIKIGDGRKRFTELPWFRDFTKVDTDCVGEPLGIPPLDETGHIPQEYLTNIRTIEVPSQSAPLPYTGSVIKPVFQNYNPRDVILTGTLWAIAPGTYFVYAKPAYGRAWGDGTRDVKTVEWTIE